MWKGYPVNIPLKYPLNYRRKIIFAANHQRQDFMERFEEIIAFVE